MNFRNENPVKPGPLQLSQRQLEVIQALQSRETEKYPVKPLVSGCPLRAG